MAKFLTETFEESIELMKKRVITLASVAAATAAISIYAIATGDGGHSVLAKNINETIEAEETTVTEESSAVEDETVIVIPTDTEKYGSIELMNFGNASIHICTEDGKEYTVDGNSQIDYADPLIVDNFNGDADFELKGNGFYYKLKASSIDSVTINPQDGLTLSGNDYSYDLSLALAQSEKNISLSGKCTGDLNISRNQSEIIVDGKAVLADVDVKTDDDSSHYQINATGCSVKSDGTVLSKDGTKLAASNENNSTINKETLAENVFHTIEPALFVRGNKTTLAKAASYVNDYVYDNEAAASALTDDTAISEYYEYYGESGRLSFSITIFGNGNHARIATSDGEVHDYIIEAQKGAHCYPLFSLG